ncbi:TraB/GumN family protein [soil metagenome]
MNRLFALIALICLLGCKPAAQTKFAVNRDANSLLWQVSGNGLKKPSFLFGTFHLLCKDDIHFSNQLLSALKASDEVYMELKLDDPAVLIGGLIFMKMRNDTTLKDLYSTQDYNRINHYFDDTLNIPLKVMGSLKPYFLVAMLYPKMMNCSSPSGVEEELMAIAKNQKKEIKGLETIQFQSSVFDSIPYQWQAKELLKNIDSFYSYKKDFQKMLLQYKQQKLDSLSKMTDTDSEGLGNYTELLVNGRNRNWVSILKDTMKIKSVFVAVGAGHLGGEAGVISLLKKEGYTVEPLRN